MLSFFYLLNLMSPKLNCRPLGKVRYNCWLEWWRGGAGGDTYIYSKKGRVVRRMKKHGKNTLESRPLRNVHEQKGQLSHGLGQLLF